MRLRNLALAVALTLQLGAMPVSAAGYDVAASCTVAPLLFVFDSRSVAPQVANGNPAGFICNGTSYVPLRFVASALGKDVGWDGGTDTVTITTPATAIAGSSAATPATPSPVNYDVAANCTVAPLQFVFDGTSEAPQVANGNPAGFICDGTSYVPLRFVVSALGKSVAWDGATDTVTVTSAPAASTVGAATNSTYGQVLVNASGMTLYLLTQDSPTFSACSGSCAALWPPLVVTGTPTLAAGLSGTLTTLKRADGTLQAEYNGMPLYTFAGDKQPGDANGQCYDGVWFVVKVGQTAPPSGSGGC